MSQNLEYYGVYTYKEPLIWNKMDNYENPYHRVVVFKKDHLLHTYITKLDEETLAELPIFEPNILKPEGEIISEWQEENWTSLFIKIMDTCRIHKWCIVVLYDKFPYWGVYDANDVINVEYSENGEALSAEMIIYKHLPYSKTSLLKFTEEVEFGEGKSGLFVNYGRPDNKCMNSDDIEYLWDLSVQLRYIKNDIVRNSAKSSGFMFMKLGPGATPDHQAYVEDVMEKANYGNMVAANEQLIVEIKDIHPENARFSIEAYDKLLKMFSGACRLPLCFFNSETEKGGIGSESKSSDDILVNKKKRFIFSMFKPIFLKLVEKRWGAICTDVFPNIEEYEEEEYRDQMVGDTNEIIEEKEND